MSATALPRKNDDLKLQYALKDAAGAWIPLSGATVLGYLLRPTSGLVTADTVNVIPSPTTYNVELVFGKAKMTDTGQHKAQVKITNADLTVLHSEIDAFSVLDNLA